MAVRVGQLRLVHQVFDQVQVLQAHVHHAGDVVVVHGREQVEGRALLEELGGGQRERAEQHHRLAVELARVQVRHRHRRRIGIGHAVGLDLVAAGDGRRVEGQELAAHREAGVVLRLGNAGQLQHLERGAARADEDEARLHRALLVGLEVLDRDVPGLVAVLAQRRDLMLQSQLEVGVALQALGQLVGDDAEVHVGAQRHVGGGDLLAGVAAFHQQRRPLADPRRVGGILHAVEQRALDQGIAALAQVLDAVIAPDEAHVAGRIDEVRRLAEAAGLDLVRPELARDLELFGDVDGPLDVDRTVGHFGGVVQLGEAGVAGARVVPAIGAFERHAVQAFEQFDAPVRLQFLQVGGERHAHDAAADEHGVQGLVIVRRRDRTLVQRPVQEQGDRDHHRHHQAAQDLEKLSHGY
ncbi:Uncharacterised protein [Achromobacter xylosoxidans]|nr:Uncharacterised protein [Achromobacter xylosoxidans]